MEPMVKELREKFGLSGKCLYYLDSILYQFNSRERFGPSGRKAMEDICVIVGRYERPADALKIIDQAIPEYFRRLENQQRVVGSFDLLGMYEELMEKSGVKPNLRGLAFRIEELVLGEVDRPLPPPRSATYDREGAGPWQENAIKVMEG
jgi:hypothetical protein